MAVNNYFWRTYDQQEIDWVEEREGNLFAYEIKWSKAKGKPPKAWSDALVIPAQAGPGLRRGDKCFGGI